MTRLSLALMFVAYTVICADTGIAQGERWVQGGTVRGQIVETTEVQNPIEAVEVKIVLTQVVRNGQQPPIPTAIGLSPVSPQAAISSVSTEKDTATGLVNPLQSLTVEITSSHSR